MSLLSDTAYIWLARLLVLFTSMPIHESAHGYAAYRLGDNTARDQGRLTLNPLAHLDIVGSLLLVLTGFGWAKPVPVDPRNFKKPKRDMAITALAGPLSNILLAFFLIILYKLAYMAWPANRYVTAFSLVMLFLGSMLTTNLSLAVFNLLPVPPLDGSKILGALLPTKLYFAMMRYERYISLILFALLWFGILTPPLRFLTNGLSLFLDWLSSPLGRIF